MTMKLDITNKKKNQLMKREELEVLLDHAGKPTPARQEILGALSSALKANKDLIIVDKIFNVKGKAASAAKVFLYQNKKDIPPEKAEKMKRRMEKKEKKPKEAAAPKEEKKEEKPEAKPEEKPAEGEVARPEGEKPKEEAPKQAPKEDKPAEPPKEPEKKEEKP